MAMDLGQGGGSMSSINVTPMIDILLVLLIIFMVIVPTTPNGLNTLVPQPPKHKQQQQTNDRTIVVQVLYQGGAPPAYKINDTSYAYSQLLPELTKIYSNRAVRVMFVRGDPNVDFRYIADVIDIGKAADVDHIGLMTPKMEAGD
jgi:biopolymer transport protein ExbD